MALQTADGEPVDVSSVEQGEREFAAAFATPPAGDLPAPPPDHKKDMATERPARRGRPPKSARGDAKAPKPAVVVPVKADYSEDATKLVGTIWTVAASIPPTQAYALVVHNASDALASALAEGAKVNPAIRRFVAGGGNAGWQLQLGAVAMQMGMQALQLSKDKELRAQAAETTRAQFKEAMKVAGLETPEETSTDDSGDV
jgi:hypothetical protein